MLASENSSVETGQIHERARRLEKLHLKTMASFKGDDDLISDATAAAINVQLPRLSIKSPRSTTVPTSDPPVRRFPASWLEDLPQLKQDAANTSPPQLAPLPTGATLPGPCGDLDAYLKSCHGVIYGASFTCPGQWSLHHDKDGPVLPRPSTALDESAAWKKKTMFVHYEQTTNNSFVEATDAELRFCLYVTGQPSCLWVFPRHMKVLVDFTHIGRTMDFIVNVPIGITSVFFFVSCCVCVIPVKHVTTMCTIPGARHLPIWCT